MKRLASIVIINKNDRAIADTLSSLRSINHPLIDHEVIVIDASEGKLDDIAAEFLEVRWIPFETISRRRFTIPEQRNAGVAAARGDIIVFTDASCVPADDWFEALLAPILTENESITAGSTVSKGGSTIHDQNMEHVSGLRYIHECPTINMAFTKKVYSKIGGFDETFDYGSDVDFSWRANNLGFRIRYIPEAVVAHDWGRSSDSLKRSFRYGIARARLYKKHPMRWRQLLTNDVTALIYPLFILSLPITYWFWPYPLLLLVPVVKNIHKQPISVLKNHLVYALGVLREVARI